MKKRTLLLAGILAALLLSGCAADTAFPTPGAGNNGYPPAPKDHNDSAQMTGEDSIAPYTERITPNEGFNPGTLARSGNS